jgi:hypothetical protein
MILDKKILYLDIKCALFIEISKGGFDFFKKRFKVIEQGWLMLQQRCKLSKGCADNKMPMSPT